MSQNEAKAVLEQFWRNVYLRGVMLYDPTGAVASGVYGQPATVLPASRWYVLDTEQRIVLGQYGYDPALAIGTIRGLLDELEGSGDLDGDDDVDVDDFDQFVACFASGNVPAGCEEGDLDGDGNLDCEDWYDFALAWTAGAPLPPFPACPAPVALTLDRTEASWAPVPGASAYDVVYGDLLALRAGAGSFATSTAGCLQDDSAALHVDHGGAPSAGQVVWLAVRAVKPDTASTYDSLGPAQDHRRDAGIAASGMDCP